MIPTNPTDDQLNTCFAEKVAGYVRRGGGWEIPPMRAIWTEPLDFTRSADAVLPWLDKKREEGRRVVIEMGFKRWRVWIHDKQSDGLYLGSDRRADGESGTFPSAAVIALLRVHGVEVVFTK